MKNIPIDMSNFKDIIEQNYLYVDKTKFIYDIVKRNKYYFLSRPRRFGKSLSVSTLQAVFEGRRELFKGLYIENKDLDWEEYPIIKLDYNEITNTSKERMKEDITNVLLQIAQKYGIKLERTETENIFNELIKKLSEKYKKGVVVLIDEYDKPIISHLGKGKERIEVAIENREFMKVLYDNLKPLEPYLRLVYITGVSKFSMTSIFSTLNNLIELDIHPEFADFLGYREEELKKYFNEYFVKLANKKNENIEDIYKDFKYMYNGFRFSREEIKVYNPYSIGKALNYQEIDHYWFDSGTPTFLIDLIKEKNYNITNIENIEVSINSIKAYDIENLTLISLLFQTGYLTIKDEDEGIYTLSYPNNEVEKGFCNQLILHMADKKDEAPLIRKIKKAFVAEDYDDFFELIESMFGGIPYSRIPPNEESARNKELKLKIRLTERELYYHTIFYLAVTLMSDNKLRIYPEILSNIGRIDMVIEMENKVYIIEFKCDQGVEVAMEQIKKKKYAQKYKHLGKKILLLGIDFDSEERNVREWKIIEN